jgi:hypothetical protein
VSQRYVFALMTVAGVFLSACNFNQAKTPEAKTSLGLDVLAVTAVDLETQNARYRVHLSWPDVPDVSRYEVIRRLEGRPASVQKSQSETRWVDDALTADQGATYKVQAVSSDGQMLTSSDERTVTVLGSQVAAPQGLKPDNNAVLDVGNLPIFTWERVDDAQWYYVSVVRANDDKPVYSALTSSTSIKFGERSPLKLEKFSDILQLTADGGLERGIVHKWTVSAVRTTGGSSPNRVTAVDIRASDLQRFSVGG